MDDKLHAAAFIEEALEDDVVLGGNKADAVSFGADVANDLLGGFGGEVAFVGEPADGAGILGAVCRCVPPGRIYAAVGSS